MDKNIIRALKKMDTSYNPASLNYINDKFNYLLLEYMLQEKSNIHQEHTYFSVLSLAYSKPQNSQEVWHHKYPEEHE